MQARRRRRAGWWLDAMAISVVVLLPRNAISASELPPPPDLHLVGPPQPVFVPTQDGCNGDDVPDAPARAFRRSDGAVVLFGLHDTNHALVGRTFDTLKIVCTSAFLGHGDPDPAAYDDRAWIAATWTRDGRHVSALLHHEFQASEHPGRCRYPTYLQCWFNTVLAARSTDGGALFTKSTAPVVASAPFPQSVAQGRHRGFFNPSNIVSDGRFFYMFASTTGWDGQAGGACLFRTSDPDKPERWRAYGGRDFTADFTSDPYRRVGAASAQACEPIAPFPAPVGSIVRQRGTGTWLAVFQAKADATLFPVSGLYDAASHDLLHWSTPRLLLQGPTNYDDPCAVQGRMLAYPSLIDPDAPDRNFGTVGSRAALYYASLAVHGCTITSDRVLLRQPVTIGPAP